MNTELLPDKAATWLEKLGSWFSRFCEQQTEKGVLRLHIHQVQYPVPHSLDAPSQGGKKYESYQHRKFLARISWLRSGLSCEAVELNGPLLP